VVLRVVLFSFLLLLLPSTVHAQKRVALVIGNASYQHAGVLANPKNDATGHVAADCGALLHPVRPLDPGEGYLARHRGTARRA
jgi:hypothetical protein